MELPAGPAENARAQQEHQADDPTAVVHATTATASESRRILFLDTDGVLVNSRSQMMDYDDDDPTLIYDQMNEHPTPIERRCVGELNRIIMATGASVVLSTTWRLDDKMRRFLVDSLDSVQVVGDTPSISGTCWANGLDGQRRKLHGRGAEITAWLTHEAENSREVQSFAILVRSC